MNDLQYTMDELKMAGATDSQKREYLRLLQARSAAYAAYNATIPGTPAGLAKWEDYIVASMAEANAFAQLGK